MPTSLSAAAPTAAPSAAATPGTECAVRRQDPSSGAAKLFPLRSEWTREPPDPFPMGWCLPTRGRRPPLLTSMQQQTAGSRSYMGRAIRKQTSGAPDRVAARPAYDRQLWSFEASPDPWSCPSSCDVIDGTGCGANARADQRTLSCAVPRAGADGSPAPSTHRSTCHRATSRAHQTGDRQGEGQHPCAQLACQHGRFPPKSHPRRRRCAAVEVSTIIPRGPLAGR